MADKQSPNGGGLISLKGKQTELVCIVAAGFPKKDDEGLMLRSKMVKNIHLAECEPFNVQPQDG